MTAEQTQIRRDTATNLNAATPADGELGFDQTNKRLVIGDGLTLGGIRIPSANDLQQSNFNYAVAGGTGNAITLAPSPAYLSYSGGCKISFKASAANTSSVTVNVNSLGNKTIKKYKNGSLSDLESGDIINGAVYLLIYDGTYFIIFGIQQSGSTSGMDLLEIVSSGTNYDFTAFSSDYNYYKFVFEDFVSSLNNAQLQMQFSTDGGSTFNTGSIYAYSISTNTSSTATLGSVRSGSSLASPAILLTDTSTSSAGKISGEILLGNVNSSGQYKSVKVNLTDVRNASPYVTNYEGGGGYYDTTAVNGIRFNWSTGTPTGKIYMYGMRAAL